MPLVASFMVDHTKMNPPSVRLSKKLKTPSGDDIEVWDLRFVKPNQEILEERGMHTFEHYLAGLIRDEINVPGKVEVIDVSPMGCKTGFYLSLIGTIEPQVLADAMLACAKAVAELPADAKIPGANPYQCGSALLHDLAGARAIGQAIVNKGVAVVSNDDLALDPKLLSEIE